MRRWWWPLMAVLFALPAAAQTGAIEHFCDNGGHHATVSGLNATNFQQQVIPHCSVAVYLTGTQTLATIYSDAGSHHLDNPFTADANGTPTPGRWIFWAAVNQGYDIVMSGGDAPNTYPQPYTLIDQFPGTAAGGGGGGGCSTGGIPTTNGSVTGDNTSTNCGYNNRVSDTATVPAKVSTFGYQNGTNNQAHESIGIGDTSLYGAHGSDIIAIGDNTYLQTGTFSSTEIVAIGDSALDPTVGGTYIVAIGSAAASDSDAADGVLIGDNAGGNLSMQDVVAIGNGAGASRAGLTKGDLTDGVAIGDGAGSAANGHDIIGIGDGSGANYATGSYDIIGIGNGSGNGFNTGSNPTTVAHDVIGIGGAAYTSGGVELIGIGDFALGPTGGVTGNDDIGIGKYALRANTSGSQNVAVGGLAGYDGTSGANANVTGSNNTWIGYDSGPNTATQLSNSTALGYQAANDASNQIVLGNSSVTQFRVPAVKTGSGIGCLQTDTSGNITNTGSGCGGGGGSGTLTNFTAPSGGWPSWLNPTVVNSTTSPSLSVTALAIPNSALANSAVTINSVICTLGGSCTISGSGTVASVANSDGTLTISPTTGSVVASLALAHANTWTAKQTQPAPLFSDITGVTQCLHVSTSGQVSGTGSDCGSGGGGGGSAWSGLTAPTSNLTLAMGANASSFVYGAATGTGDLFRLVDTTGNTGTGIMGHFATASGSAETPWQADANGVGWKVATDGSLQGVGASLYQGVRFPSASALPTPVAASAGIYTDPSANLQAYENGGSFSRICTVGNIQCGSGGGGTPQYIAPQAIAGCGVQYVSGLTYTVGACKYSINGVTYNSPLSSITLPAADATNPEIDVIFVDTTGVVQVIQGTPAVTPQQPVVDPSTQLQLTFVLVPSTATTPANTTTVTIYDENTEWTSAKGGTSSANVTLASTNNPYHGTLDTEFGAGGAVASTTYAQYTDPAAGTVTLGNYNTLTFYLRNKAAWAKTRSITVQWYNGSTPLGTAVVLSDGAYGFSATGNFTSYQQVSIPTSTFGIANSPATTVRFTVSGSGSSLTGFYLDFVTLQGGSGGIVLPTTLMNFKGPWTSTATYQPNDTVVSGGIGYVALASNTNIAVSTTATWSALGTPGGSSAFSALTAGTNTTAAMLVGSGASLAPTGTGTIQATNIASTIAAGSGVTISGSGTTGSPYSIAASGSAGTTVDVLSDQRGTGTPFFQKNEYTAMVSGTPITVLSRTGAGVVSNIFLVLNAASTLAASSTLTITVNGEGSPYISVPLSAYFVAGYAGQTNGATFLQNRLMGLNVGDAGFGLYSRIPIPYSNGITITVTPGASGGTFWSQVSGNTITDSWPGTEKLWVSYKCLSSSSPTNMCGTATGAATASYAQEQLVNYAGSNPGRYLGTYLLTDDNPGSASPHFATLEGDYRIFTDSATATWAATTSMVASTTIMDPNGNQQTSAGGTTGGTIPSSWGCSTGATTSDGSVTWTAKVGEPGNIWRASAAYSKTCAMSIWDTNGNVETLTTTGTSGSSQPTWPVTGSCPATTTTDGTAVWTCSLGSTAIKAALVSSGSEDYFLAPNYGQGIPVSTGAGENGVTFAYSSAGGTVGFFRLFLSEPIRFGHSIAVYRENGDSSEIGMVSGTTTTMHTSWFYTQDTN